MYLKRLEIQGFKTFANRTVIEFPLGVTAIVGPNGSGKSNVTDAIRWVLGEQSFSALRCRRTEDLIYSGGGKRAAQGMAEVALTIDNTDRTLPLDFNEVTIMRRSFRSGENEYFLNKNKVRLRDIQEATSPLASSYTLINQGLVDAALTLRPEERRSLFEDAASISLSVSKRAEAERRLKQTEENLGRILDTLAEIEPRLKVLRRQAREAEQVHEIETALQQALLVAYRRQWQAAQSLVAQAETTFAAAEQAVAQAQTAHSQSEHQLGELRQQRDAQQQVVEQQQQQLAQFEREWETIEREWAVLSERQQALITRRDEAHERQQTFEHEQNQAHARALELAEQAAQAQAALLAQRQALSTIEAGEQATIAARREAEQALKQAEAAALQASKALNEAEQRAKLQHERWQALANELAANQHKLAASQERIQQAQTQHEQAQSLYQQAELAFNQAQANEEAAQKSLLEARNLRREQEEAVAFARREADALHSRLDALRRTAAAGAGMFTGVRAALQWAEKQQRQFAVVASVIEVPAELETALEVALGARLQNIIVPQWDDAEAAIAELKRSDAGRATFLPLDSLRSPRPSRIPQAKGVLGMASELVNYAENYERAVQYLLGRTIVVEDLATARRILAELDGGWTIVTLGGEQVGSSGAMTGGAKTREAGTLRRERELRELPAQLANAQHQLASHEQSLKQAIDTIGAAEKAVREADHVRRTNRSAMEKARDSVAQRQRGLQQSEQEHQWQAQRSTNVQQEQTSLGEQIAASQAEIERHQSLVAEHERLVAAARDQAETAADASRASEERVAAARAAIVSSDATLQATQRAQRDQQQVIDGLVRRSRDDQQRQHELAEQLALTEAQSVVLAERRQQASAQREAANAEQAPLLAALNRINLALQQAEQHERAASQTFVQAQASLSRAESQVASANTRRDHVWERCAEENIDIEQLDLRQTAEFEQAELSAQALNEQIDQLRNKLRRMGTINPLAPQEYAELGERHQFLTEQVRDIRHAADGLRALINELETAMNSRFAQTFSAVAEEFSQAFTRLFGGGTAQLILNDPNSSESGIDIIAQPPGKRRQPLSLLSGGERSLTAVALLVALLKVNPTPFCVMDEVDAALDEANVVRLREQLLEMSQHTQFVLVTHNRGTVEAASTLYGVTMNPDGASKILSIRLDQLVDDGGAVRIVETVG
ncbi:chromosome segregation protein SMC [Herpetosiphon llansteffanensis]|uniref:chromosome segregation protein SMC n=1 Tax=Herpetosiphon llansteffanensis TaxID=2094568 RepID=UPI000D7BC8F9|nr:chromosome segregation protein SMC [Herpetosiphon llansteffanensis]